MADILIEEALEQLRVIAMKAKKAHDEEQPIAFTQLMDRGRVIAKRVKNLGTGTIFMVKAIGVSGTKYKVYYQLENQTQVKILLSFDIKERLLSYNIGTIICRDPIIKFEP
tara:strand:- start:550 stop:882 length:333 start_codon:yes stop_codon:yes gene_type:complete